MKKIIVLSAALCFLFFGVMRLDAGPKTLGERCVGDAECGLNMECASGVCVQRKAFDTGSRQSGKPCNSNADCINAGSCVDNGFGTKLCTGN